MVYRPNRLIVEPWQLLDVGGIFEGSYRSATQRERVRVIFGQRTVPIHPPHTEMLFYSIETLPTYPTVLDLYITIAIMTVTPHSTVVAGICSP